MTWRGWKKAVVEGVGAAAVYHFNVIFFLLNNLLCKILLSYGTTPYLSPAQIAMILLMVFLLRWSAVLSSPLLNGIAPFVQAGKLCVSR